MCPVTKPRVEHIHMQVGCQGVPAAPLDARRRCTPHRQTAVCRLLTLMSDSDAAARTHWEASEPQAGAPWSVKPRLCLPSPRDHAIRLPLAGDGGKSERMMEPSCLVCLSVRPPVWTLLLHAAEPMLDPRLAPLSPCPLVESGHE
jgi:hypothetical protein